MSAQEFSETTPQDLSTLPRAGLGRRLLALLYDAFLVAAIWMLLGYLVQLVFGTDGNQLVAGRVRTDPVQDAVLFMLMLASSFGFYAYFWTRSGQTLGMIAWRIKLESVNGGLVSPAQALVRYLAAWPSFLLLLLGYLWIKLDPAGDAWHDRLSRSKVVRLPKSYSPFQD